MEPSRKIMLYALALLFISQFFAYTPSGQTSITLDMDRSLSYGGLPFDGDKGWTLHKWWFLVPVLALLAYQFFKSSPRMFVYCICLGVIFIMGLGSGFGAILGEISILIAGYSVYRKRKETIQKVNV